MRKWAFVLLGVVCCASIVGSAYAAVLEKGDTVYTRSNLRANGGSIFWHNMRTYKTVIPVGTEVKIGGGTTFVIVGTKETFTVIVNANQLDKFFVKNKSDIGISNLSPEVKIKVENCEVGYGMTKKEVYASKGCPAYLAWGEKTKEKSFGDIMQSDTWYYNFNARGQDVMVTFRNGKVVKTGVFEK